MSKSNLSFPFRKEGFVLFIWLVIGSSMAFGQRYYNSIIPFEVGNPTTVGLYEYQGLFVVPVIYPSDSSTLVLVEENEIQYIHYVDFVFSSRPLTIIDNHMFLYAKDRNQSKDLRCMRLHSDFSQDWLEIYQTNGEFNFPTYSIALDNHIYCSYLIDFDDGAHREIGLRKIDTLGNEIWASNFSQQNKLNYIWSLDTTFDRHLLVASRVVYHDVVGGFPELTKVNVDGDTAWYYASQEGIINGSAPVWIAQLSDSTIVQAYEIDRRNDPDFIVNNWDREPTRLRWFSKDGEPLHETLTLIPRPHELHYYQLKSGKGDYFFAFGEYQEDDIDHYYGLLVKYANNGDTIWSRRFQHPDFEGADVFHRIRDIHEFDNGDIVAMGSITPVGERNQIWLFRINEAGCFGTSTCDEVVTSTFEIDIGDSNQLVYPNPTQGFVHLLDEWRHRVRFVDVYDIHGVFVMRGFAQGGVSIDLTALSPGLFVLKFQLDNGQNVIEKIVKL